ncbi:MAG: hypothetical protein HDS15_04260 [Bacteroides sp.]|nr:hypothetical protein [Bacteroides sp.]
MRTVEDKNGTKKQTWEGWVILSLQSRHTDGHDKTSITTMKKTVTTLLLMLIAAATALAQNGTITVKTLARQGLNGQAMEKVRAYLTTTEGTDTIEGTSSYSWIINGDRQEKQHAVRFKVPKEHRTYTLTAEAEGYETITREVKVNATGKRTTVIELPDLMFYKKARELGEVTVTASKVKFYMKDDTLVYNADAFLLPQGSMLDALIRQLPGVEFRDNGRIYVNGKYVESLMLNGKDFFDGDKNVMLNNLGAYTVKDVAVYDKLGDKSMLAGRDLGDAKYVMDVRLKRDYMSGFVGNLEAGAGTSDRYLGRAFGMWYTTISRVALIGALNNLNDNRTPGQNDAWKPTTTAGDLRTKMGALDYFVEPDNGKTWTLSGNTSVEHSRLDDRKTMNRVNFLPGGDTYDNSFGQTLTHDLNIRTKNDFRRRYSSGFFTIGQRLTYRKNDLEGSTLSGAFNREAEELTRNLLEQMFAGEAISMADNTINTALSRRLSKGHTLSAGGSASGSKKIAGLPDLISLSLDGEYTERSYDNFNLYDIRYPRTGKRTLTNQYITDSPDRSWTISAFPSYDMAITEDINVTATVALQHTSTTKDSYLYELDRLEDAGIFGVLPEGYGAALDRDRTYMSHSEANMAQLSINARGHNIKMPGGSMLSYQVYPIIRLGCRTLDYTQGRDFSRVDRRNADVEFLNTYLTLKKGKGYVKLLFNRTTKHASLIRMVDITDSRDPLNIFTGSPDLKNEAHNELSAQWSQMANGRHRWMEIVDLRYTFINNALTNGYRYDEASGVRTYRMYNVNGNYNLRLYNSLTKSFGKRDQFDISSYTSADYGEAADMVATTETAMTRTKVKNLILLESVQLNWTIGRSRLSLNGRLNWRDTRGDRTGFNNFSATTAQYGAAAVIALPHNFSLSTDLNLYTRRGYAYRELNTTDVVWNARLSYTAKGGRWLFMLDGFDLLNQLSNVSYNVNAQGRTETFTNVLPRYGLLHIQYRFMVQPKNKN